MENFKEKANKILSRIFKHFKIGLMISLGTAILSIPYGYIKAGSPFRYTLAWLFIAATVITVFALLSNMGVGSSAYRSSSSKRGELESKLEIQDKKEDKIESFIKKREENASLGFDIGVVGVTIYLVATIIDILQRL